MVDFFGILFKLRRGIKRRFFGLFNYRPASFPYISGDTFRRIADFVYEKDVKFDPKKIYDKAIVFLDINFIDEYFKNVHQEIDKKYVLITHNGDVDLDFVLVEKYLDNKIIHWFGQNVLVADKRLTPIPIGLENKHYYNNGITSYFDEIIGRKIEKKNRILFGFNISTNPKERQSAYDVLVKSNLADEIEGWPISRKYLEKLFQYRFVASPPGNGTDCHRTWEALYLGIIPIVKRSVLTEHFFNKGLPLWIIDDWEELNGVDDEFLEAKFNLLKDRFGSGFLFMDFWESEIYKISKG